MASSRATSGKGSISRMEAEKWLSEGGKRRVCSQLLLHAASRRMSGVRMFPVGRDVVVEGRSDSNVVRLPLLSPTVRKPLFDAFLELAGVPAGSDLPPETIFHLESEAGVAAFQASFLQGLSGPEVIIKILPDLRVGSPSTPSASTPASSTSSKRSCARERALHRFFPRARGAATTLFSMLARGTVPAFAPSPSRSATGSGTKGISSSTGGRRRSGFPPTGRALAESSNPTS